MKKVKNLLYLFCIVIMITSCNKDDENLPIEKPVNIITSEWLVQEKTRSYLNDSLRFEGTYLFTVQLNENGTGTIIGGGDDRPFYWVQDDNLIIIVEVYDNNASTSTKYDIVLQEENYQEWINDRVMTDVQNGDIRRFVSEWKMELK